MQNNSLAQVSLDTAGTTVSSVPISLLVLCSIHFNRFLKSFEQVSPATAGTTSGVFGLGSKFRFLIFFNEMSSLSCDSIIAYKQQAKKWPIRQKFGWSRSRVLRNQKIDAVFHWNRRSFSHQCRQVRFYEVQSLKTRFIAWKLSPRAGLCHQQHVLGRLRTVTKSWCACSPALCLVLWRKESLQSPD